MIYCCNVRAGIVQRLERELPKLVMRVQFPLPAPLIKPPFKAALLMEGRRVYCSGDHGELVGVKGTIVR